MVDRKSDLAVQRPPPTIFLPTNSPATRRIRKTVMAMKNSNSRRGHRNLGEPEDPCDDRDDGEYE